MVPCFECGIFTDNLSESTWSLFAAPSLAPVSQCSVATLLMLPVLGLGLACRLAVTTISTKTDLPPLVKTVAVSTVEVEANGDLTTHLFVESTQHEWSLERSS